MFFSTLEDIYIFHPPCCPSFPESPTGVVFRKNHAFLITKCARFERISDAKMHRTKIILGIYLKKKTKPSYQALRIKQ